MHLLCSCIANESCFEYLLGGDTYTEWKEGRELKSISYITYSKDNALKEKSLHTKALFMEQN